MSDIRDELPPKEREYLLSLGRGYVRECRDAIEQACKKGLETKQKLDTSIVTSADVAAEERFRSAIRKTYPKHGVIGEEFGRENPKSDYQWIIDPIDGTAEFARGLPFYGIILALHYKQRPLIGIIDYPALKTTFWGVYGLGVFKDGNALTKASTLETTPRIAIAARTNFLRAGRDGSDFDKIVAAYPDLRVFHSCYAHSCVVSNSVDVGVEWNVRIWDLAATQVMIEELGGQYLEQVIQSPEQPEPYYSAIFGRAELVKSITKIVNWV